MITFVSGYSQNLYNVSGHRLINSFRSTGNDKFNKLITYSEDGAPANHIIDSDMLDWFKQTYKKYIPEQYGGEAGPCDCYWRHTVTGQIKHKGGCHWSLWNRNAYRWFHKVVAINQAASIINTKYLIWIDCDCIFSAPLKFTFLDPNCKNRDLAYLRGTKREAIESGILVFNLERNGQKIIDLWMNRYQNGQFLTDHRWDDGFQITRVVERHKEYQFMDMAKTCTTTDPAKECLLSGYIYHFKGIHGRKGLGAAENKN